MRTGCIAVLSGVLAVFSQLSYAQLKQGEKDTIAIGGMKTQPSVEKLCKSKGKDMELQRITETLDSQFISQMSATRVFQIVERKRKEDLELEQAYAAVAVDPNDKDAAKQLKMAGAKYILLPQVDGFEDKSETQQQQEIGRKSMSRKLFLSALVQIIDTSTGKLLPDAPSVQVEKTESIEMARTEASTDGSDQVIVELAKETANKLSQKVVAVLRPAKVLAVTGKQIMINRGTEAGFVPEVMVEFYATEAIKDDDTGETVNNEVPVGRGKVIRSDAQKSFASIEGEDTGIAKGCVARIIEASAAEPPVKKSPASKPASKPDGKRGKPDANEDTPGSSEKPLKM